LEELFGRSSRKRCLEKNLLNFYEQLKALLNRDRHQEKIRTQLAILPVEAQQAARQIRIRDFSGEEQAKVKQLIKVSQTLVMQCTALITNPYVLPESIGPILRPGLMSLETGFGQMLETFVECFRRGDSRRPFPSLREAEVALNESMQTTRDSGLSMQLNLDEIRQLLEVTNRYQSMAEALEECSGVMQRLKSIHGRLRVVR
jgi:hypothetical protein